MNLLTVKKHKIFQQLVKNVAQRKQLKLYNFVLTVFYKCQFYY